MTYTGARQLFQGLRHGMGFRRDAEKNGYNLHEVRSRVLQLQQLLETAGASLGKDGIYGDETEEAIRDIQRRDGFVADGVIRDAFVLWLIDGIPHRQTGAPLVWGQKVSPSFREKVREIARALYGPPNLADWIMSVMAFETGYTFDPAVRNRAGSGAVGLIQFMPLTAAYLLGMDLNDPVSRKEAAETFAGMSSLEQLDYVYKHFRPYRRRMTKLSDVYMAVLYPAAVGKPENHTIISDGVAYRQNAGLDLDRDGSITKAEAAEHVRKAYERGKHYRA